MKLFTDHERTLAAGISKLVYCNPFLPSRMQVEREVLGAEFVEADFVWNVFNDPAGERPNLTILQKCAENLAPVLRQRLLDGARPGQADLQLYEDVILYLLYYRVQEPLRAAIVEAAAGKRKLSLAGVYRSHLAAAEQFLRIPGINLPSPYEPEHLFACFFQLRRAFLMIFQNIVGRSHVVAGLRAEIWQSIFTHDMRRFRQVMYKRMSDFTTLISGESGTGKELVARAIAMSPYIPFDSKRGVFVEDFAFLFHPLNLSALSPTLIESELFGHRRGAFTGALEDRAGWLEQCQPLGTVFLDEIGELDGQIQVKLLRVLQARIFQRLGDTQPRAFRGKLLAATNRDLATEMSAGRFRKDFYYRLCSDLIVAPSLRQQFAQRPEDLREMVAFIVNRVAGEDCGQAADDVWRWIDGHISANYPWPGNFRELEQCVRNVLIRREYKPSSPPAVAADDLMALMSEGKLTADELIRRYCRMVYEKTGNYEETARKLGLDRRTVRKKAGSPSRPGAPGP